MKELQGSEITDFAALHAPVAPLTWELHAELPGTSAETGDIPVRFLRPVEITGLFAVVIPKRPLGGGGLIIPSIDDIEVQLTSDNEDLWTKRLTESGSEGGMVPLGGLTVAVPRLLRIVPLGDAPDFTWKFSWAQFVSAASPIYEDAIIRLAIYARYISKETRDAWIAENKLR
jgi:hypothetical protein